MSQEPSILEIDPSWRREIEDMGSKPKFWFRYQDEMWLFKQARPNTGEHWAEKVASEIAALLGLPTHDVTIARFDGRMGCACRSFLKNENVEARKGLSPMALAEMLAAEYPDLVKPWINRVAALPEDFAVPLLEGIPASCMSQASREFVLAFLAESRKMIATIL